MTAMEYISSQRIKVGHGSRVQLLIADTGRVPARVAAYLTKRLGRPEVPHMGETAYWNVTSLLPPNDGYDTL